MYLGVTVSVERYFGTAVQEPLRLLFSQQESCRDLGSGLRTLQNLIASSQIPVCRIGRRVFIARRDLEAFARRDHPQTGNQEWRPRVSSPRKTRDTNLIFDDLRRQKPPDEGQ